jgi:hypothetical protein
MQRGYRRDRDLFGGRITCEVVDLSLDIRQGALEVSRLLFERLQRLLARRRRRCDASGERVAESAHAETTSSSPAATATGAPPASGIHGAWSGESTAKTGRSSRS